MTAHAYQLRGGQKYVQDMSFVFVKQMILYTYVFRKYLNVSQADLPEYGMRFYLGLLFHKMADSSN